MKVYFFQDNSFFRTKNGTNPFFDPIIRVCEENGIEWKVWTRESCAKCGYPKEKMGYFGGFSILSIFVCRFLRLVLRMDRYRAEILFAKLMKPLWWKKFKADLFITIAGNMCVELMGMFPWVRNVDIQHGVIYSKHASYFGADGRLRKLYQEMQRREFWLYGKGYVECFLKHPDNAKDLVGRVKVIGDVFGHDVASPAAERNLVVISAQFKPDYSEVCMEKQVELLRDFLKNFEAKYRPRYELLIKHHPRFKGIVALDELYKEFPWLKVTQESWQDLYSRMFVHVTFSSTVVFDAASNGIPSYLMDPPADEPLLENWFWKDDYGYPYAENSFDAVMRLAESAQTRNMVRSWYERFYSKFDAAKCLALIENTTQED